ncbi:hypothetical protein Pint_28340 [Pistacia integerrima]|uniref:Uncharacterized protein n=1 Tax=Pistacia integerrima TaxID=434235 RepID=A0ACC0YPL6_9ROSI|nr:hypothetical protein Pint_28340 [Pistacia integerrima]
MVQRTVLKVDLSCQKCKKQLLKAVSALQGVDKIEADAAKGTLTVTGNADPYEIIIRTRKTGKFVQVVSIGPPPPPPKQDGQKKPEQKAPIHLHNPYSGPLCDRMTVVHVGRHQDPTTGCSIL